MNKTYTITGFSLLVPYKCVFVYPSGEEQIWIVVQVSPSFSDFCCPLIIESYFLLSSNSKFFDSFWEAGALEHMGEVDQSETGRSVSLEALSLVSGTSVRDFPPGLMYIRGKWKPVAQRLPGAAESETKETRSSTKPLRAIPWGESHWNKWFPCCLFWHQPLSEKWEWCILSIAGNEAPEPLDMINPVPDFLTISEPWYLGLAFIGRSRILDGKSGLSSYPVDAWGATWNTIFLVVAVTGLQSQCPALASERFSDLPSAKEEWSRVGNGQFYLKGDSLCFR